MFGVPTKLRIANTLRNWRQASHLEGRLIGGLYWTLVGTAAVRGAEFVAVLVLAHVLGRDAFGKYGAIDSTVGMFSVIGNLGLSLSAIKFISRFRTIDPARAGRILALCYVLSIVAGSVAAVAMIVVAPWLAKGALSSPSLAFDLQLAAFALMLSALNGTLNGAMLGLQAFRANGLVNVVVGIVSLPLLVSGALVGGLRGAIVGMVAVQVLNALAMSLSLKTIAKQHGVRVEWRECLRECGTVLRFSVHALLNSSLVAPINWVLVILLVNYGGGYSQLGLLEVANSWFLVLLFIPGKLLQVYYPLLEEMVAAGEQAKSRAFVWKLMRWKFLVFGAGALALSLASGFILRLYGQEFLAARPALIITVWTAACVAVQQPLGAFALAHSRMWQVTFASLCWAAVSILGFVELFSYERATGAATARLVGYCVYALIMGGITLWMLSRDDEQVAALSQQPVWTVPATG